MNNNYSEKLKRYSFSDKNRLENLFKNFSDVHNRYNYTHMYVYMQSHLMSTLGRDETVLIPEYL